MPASFSLVRQGQTSVELAQVEVLLPGVSYGLRQSVLHAVHPLPQTLTASVVLKSPATSVRAIVLAQHKPVTGGAIPILDLPPRALTKYFSEVLPLLSHL